MTPSTFIAALQAQHALHTTAAQTLADAIRAQEALLPPTTLQAVAAPGGAGELFTSNAVHEGAK